MLGSSRAVGIFVQCLIRSVSIFTVAMAGLGVSLKLQLRVSQRAYCSVLAVAVFPDRGIRRAPSSPSSIHHLSLRVRPLYTSLSSYGFKDKETLLGVHFTFGKQLRTLPWTVYYGISLCFRLVP